MSTLTPERVHAALFQLAIHEAPAGPLRAQVASCIDWQGFAAEGEPLPHEVVAARAAAGLLMTPPKVVGTISDDSRHTIGAMASVIAGKAIAEAFTNGPTASDLWGIAATLAGLPKPADPRSPESYDTEGALRSDLGTWRMWAVMWGNRNRSDDDALRHDVASRIADAAQALQEFGLGHGPNWQVDIAAGIRQLGAREAAAKAELAEAKATRSFNGLQVQLHAANERVKEAEARAERAEAALADLRKARGTLPAAQRIRVTVDGNLIVDVLFAVPRVSAEPAPGLLEVTPEPAAPSKPQPGDRVPWAEVEDGCLYQDSDRQFLVNLVGRSMWLFSHHDAPVLHADFGWERATGGTPNGVAATALLVARDLGTDPEAWRAAMREHLAKQKA